MKKPVFFLLLLMIGVLGIISYRVTNAFYNDTEISTGNLFAAASVFGTPTPTPSPSPSPSPSPTPPPIAQTLVINEFLWNSSCTPNADQKFWIELYNGSSGTINLKDWKFVDNNGNVIQISNSNHNLAPGAYILLTKSNSTFSSCYTNLGGVDVLNLGGNPNFSPAATGGVIKLENPSSVVIDRVEYGPTLNSGSLNTSNDQSIARSPNGVDSALGDTFNASDFAVDSTPSPGVSN